MSYTSKLAWESENERLLEKLRAKGIEVRSFDDWRNMGRYVKCGQKRKAFTVQSGYRKTGIDPMTGEDEYLPVLKTAYGFTVDQVG